MSITRADDTFRDAFDTLRTFRVSSHSNRDHSHLIQDFPTLLGSPPERPAELGQLRDALCQLLVPMTVRDEADTLCGFSLQLVGPGGSQRLVD